MLRNFTKPHANHQSYSTIAKYSLIRDTVIIYANGSKIYFVPRRTGNISGANFFIRPSQRTVNYIAITINTSTARTLSELILTLII